MKNTIFVVALAMLLGIAETADAQNTTFIFKLDEAQEVPAPSPAFGATGIGIVVLDPTAMTISCTIYHDVDDFDSATAAHIHIAPAGSTSMPVLLFSSPTSPISQTFNVSAAQIADLQAGDFYVNVHSSANGLGQIRGQVVNAGPAKVFINEYCNDPFDSGAPMGLDTNGDGVAATSSAQQEDEFVELVNGTCQTVDLGGWEVLDAAGIGTVRHTFQAGTMLAPGAAIVVFGGGDVTSFNAAGCAGVVASTGQLGFNNGADTVELRDDTGTTIDSHSWTSGGTDDGDGESITRSPEVCGGTFTMHTMTAAATSHSAGATKDGCKWEPAVLPAPPAPMFPGNLADCDITVQINGTLEPDFPGVHDVNAGDAVSLRFFSPMGTLDDAGVAFAVNFGAPVGPTPFPGDPIGMGAGGLWMPVTPGAAFIVLNGLGIAGNPFAPTLGQGLGFLFSVQIPMNVQSGDMFTLQIVVDAPGYNAVNLGVSNARLLQVP